MALPPPILEYRDKTLDKFPWHKIRVSWMAAAVLGALAVFIFLFNRHGSPWWPLMSVPVYISGLVYVIARILECSDIHMVLTIKVFAGGISTALAPFVLCREISVIEYTRAYGWSDRRAFGDELFILLAAFVLLFLIGDLLQLIHRFRSKRGS